MTQPPVDPYVPLGNAELGTRAAYPYGALAPAPPGLALDPQSGFAIPPGTALASVGRRVGGHFLEFALIVVTLGIGWFVWSLVVWTQGRTPAKQLLDMRCWRPDDARPPGFWWMVVRQVVGGVVEGLIGGVLLLVSLIMIVVNPQRRAIHDYLAGTIVLHDPAHRIPV